MHVNIRKKYPWNLSLTDMPMNTTYADTVPLTADTVVCKSEATVNKAGIYIIELNGPHKPPMTTKKIMIFFLFCE